MGATFDYDGEKNVYNISTKGLKGTHILMDEISVTGTANMVMAAVLADGVTQIYNAACEPVCTAIVPNVESNGVENFGHRFQFIDHRRGYFFARDRS